MTLFFGEVCEWKNIGYRGNVHRVVRQKNLSTSDRAARDSVGNVMAFLVEFLVLGVHVAVHGNVKS